MSERLFLTGLIFAMAFAVYVYARNQKENMTDAGGVSQSDREKYIKLRIKMFSKQGCGFCKKAVMMLSSANLLNNTQIIDIDSEPGKEMFTQIKENGVPCFVSGVTDKRHSGLTDIKSIIRRLE